jgi:hypothetical protein
MECRENQGELSKENGRIICRVKLVTRKIIDGFPNPGCSHQNRREKEPEEATNCL